MAFGFRYSRLAFSLSLRWLFVSVCAATVMAVVSGTAEASIIVAEAPEFTLDDRSESGMGTNSGAGDSDSEKPSNDSKNVNEQQSKNHDIFNGGSPSGTSSSSSSTGNGGSSFSALAGLTTAYFSDPAFAGWVSGEQRFALPSPPGNDLLRPPQAV